MKSELEKFVLEVRRVLKPLAEINEQINSFLKKNPDFIKNLNHYLKNWPDYHKEDWAKLAKYGWFLNWETPVTVEVALSKGKATLDRFMSIHLNESWDDITNRLISLYPERSHILNVAFTLHKDGNYIACIPLFLSQIDGICSQNLGTYLFSEHPRRREEIQRIMEDSGDSLTNAFLEVLNSETQFGAKISSHNRVKKDLAPNRNGILHGSRKHLDYGTEINSLKSFSLLAFIVYCFENNKSRRSKSRHQ